MTEPLISWLQEAAGVDAALQIQLLKSVVAILAVWLIHHLLLRFAVAGIDEPAVRYRTRKLVTYVAVLAGFIIVGRIWYSGVGSLATFLGLLSAGLAIALRDMISSLAGWLFIIWRRPFDVGDRIQVGDVAGDVIDQRIFQFSVLEMGNWVDADQPTGRIIHVPNSKVFSEPQANYTRGIRYIWNELPILVTFESDWQAAKAILQEIALRNADDLSQAAIHDLKQARGRFLLHDVDVTPRVYTSVQDSGVLLTIRYLSEPRRRRATAERIWEDVLRAFDERDDIDFAYPSVRVFNNTVEGKSGARAPYPFPTADYATPERRG